MNRVSQARAEYNEAYREWANALRDKKTREVIAALEIKARQLRRIYVDLRDQVVA